MSNTHNIYLISDSTGETLDRIFLAIKAQFKNIEYKIDKSNLLGLNAPEMTVLLGGLRMLDVNYKNSDLGVFTSKKETLSNDFFDTLLDMSVQWKPNGTGNSYEAFDRKSGEKVRTASRSDLVFGLSSSS